jgi:hypothetical protein
MGRCLLAGGKEETAPYAFVSNYRSTTNRELPPLASRPELLDNSNHQISLIHGITTVRLKAIQIIVDKNLDYIVQRHGLRSLVEERERTWAQHGDSQRRKEEIKLGGMLLRVG